MAAVLATLSGQHCDGRADSLGRHRLAPFLRVFRFRDRGVDYALADLGKMDAAQARQHAGDAFDQLFDELFDAVQPDVFLTYEGWLSELERWLSRMLKKSRAL